LGYEVRDARLPPGVVRQQLARWGVGRKHHSGQYEIKTCRLSINELFWKA
jgi:hypothetical protein